ncbi:calcium-transporting ATPase 8, plasma membrane-type-like isoform X3 [Arachis stenosperma]|uniref:calcium-transporting ATPase 8, plasma membrane-type-like isoform X3 n=1 Tax=Arachis stenosperma TaxID=217475 RepID=UPI0025ACD9C6|nr:calcium-transporting ATPase 8, plasma membrane-type-like isoform X3 [Arachis stenosperma]
MSETTTPPPTNSEFGIGQEQLCSLSTEQSTAALELYGGVVGISNLLNTSLAKGIHGDEADLLRRRRAFGSNNYPRRRRKGFLIFVWEACKDPTLLILLVSAAILLALGIKSKGVKEGWYDGGSIAFAAFIVIVVTAMSEYRQYVQFHDTNEKKRNIHLEVIRGGRRIKISIYDIVVGDVIPLNIGDQVPADGILISPHPLAIDESSIHGESIIVHKDSRAPFLMSGCKVQDGSGTMLVIGVGINTEWGLQMAISSDDPIEETPLQARLNGVATFFGIVGLSVTAVILTVLLARYFTGHTRNLDGNVQFIAGKTRAVDAIHGAVSIVTIAVTSIVVAVPDSLPLTVNFTLAFSLRKLMASKILVRKLFACEMMGSATVICSDKTGTLTMNQMIVVEAYAGGRKIDPPSNGLRISPKLQSLLIEGVAQNTNGNVYLPEGCTGIEISGSPTEKAILHWGVQIGMDFEAARSESSIIHMFPFNAEKKRGGVAIQKADHEIHIHWKGAAEIILARCTWYLDTNDHLMEMNEEKMAFFNQIIEDMAAKSLRCVAIAYRPWKKEDIPVNEEQWAHLSILEDDLILLAIVGLKDPCRPGIKTTVQLCRNAGVKVIMFTGDNINTAKAIALECGILSSFDNAIEPCVIEGREFRALTDEQRKEIAEKIVVMGRSSPNDKLLLVEALRKRGHIIAVIGDGTNDAPALYEADVGLAMGIQGSQIAKESSDIILMDDNFASILKLLWVNLIMDTLGALALATEQPTNLLMNLPPVGRREPLISNTMWRNILIQVVYQVSVLLALNFQGSIPGFTHDATDHGIKLKKTLIFDAFVLCQILNEFNARKLDEFNIFKGVTRNYLFMGIIGLTVVLQFIIIEFLGKFTSTVRLNWKQWFICVIIGFISWPLGCLGKLIPVPDTPINNKFRRILHGRTQMQSGQSTTGERPSYSKLVICCYLIVNLFSRFQRRRTSTHQVLYCSAVTCFVYYQDFQINR